MKFKLNISDYAEIKDLSIINVLNKQKCDILSDDIKFLIDSFNAEYKWDGMFDFNDVQNRISLGHYFFILYYGHNAIGYIFYEPKENDEFYLYNLYVTNCYERPSFSPQWFINKSINLLPKGFLKITCVCEDWHTAAHNVFTQNGFTKYE